MPCSRLIETKYSRGNSGLYLIIEKIERQKQKRIRKLMGSTVGEEVHFARK